MNNEATETCKHPNPAECRRLKMHLHGRLWDIWNGRGMDRRTAQAYRSEWLAKAGLPDEPLPMPGPAKCRHLGGPTGKTEPCGGCAAKTGMRISLKTFHCAIHVECTTDTQLPNVKCCQGCPDRNTAKQVIVSVDGIGDHMMALSVAAAWKEAHPGEPLTIAVRHRQWIELFSDYDEIHDWPADAEDVAPTLTNRGGAHFVEAVARHPDRRMPTMRPLPPAAVEWAERWRGAVVLCPMTLWGPRNWPLDRWHDLETKLAVAGYRCVAIASGDNTEQIGGFRSPAILGEPAARVAALMLASALVIGNESGMAHLAGALRVPCVVLSWFLDGQAIHGFWPRSTVIQERSGQAISSARVFSVVESVLGDCKPFLNDSGAETALRAMFRKLRCESNGMPARYDRSRSMALALRQLVGHTEALIVETGCQRQDEDWSAGMSTSLFGYFLKHNGGRLISVDNDPAHVEFARSRASGLPVEVVLSDSRPWLREYNGRMIDLLYLDSADTYVAGYAECCLEEAQAGSKHVQDAILIDDTVRDGDGWSGKGRLAIPWLLKNGWRVHYQAYQTLLRRI